MKSIAFVCMLAVLLLCAGMAEAGVGLSQSSTDELGASASSPALSPQAKELLAEAGYSVAEVERAQTIMASPEIAQFLQDETNALSGGDAGEFLLLVLLIALIVCIIIVLSNPRWWEEHYY